MKVIAVHVLEDENGNTGRFEELDDGSFVYLHFKLRPWIITKEAFGLAQDSKKLPQVSSLT